MTQTQTFGRDRRNTPRYCALRDAARETNGDNGSAFFFCLHPPGKSAMAEILVSDLCALSPALLGGLCSLGRHRPHTTTSEDLNRSQPDVSTRPDFRLFRLLCALFFPLFAIVLAPANFLKPAQSLVL
jgi:hypothetical protein